MCLRGADSLTLRTSECTTGSLRALIISTLNDCTSHAASQSCLPIFRKRFLISILRPSTLSFTSTPASIAGKRDCGLAQSLLCSSVFAASAISSFLMGSERRIVRLTSVHFRIAMRIYFILTQANNNITHSTSQLALSPATLEISARVLINCRCVCTSLRVLGKWDKAH